MPPPKCKYSPNCYRTNADHRRDFWHPEEVVNEGGTAAKEEGHSNESELRDEGKHPVSTQANELFLSRNSPTSIGIKQIEGQGEQDRELDGDYGPNEVESDISGQASISCADYQPSISSTVLKADGVIILILIGPPGSGKSTFCSKLMSNAAQPWTRICQDIISNGKRGTKQQCLKHAELRLAKHQCVVIDRCNIDRAQRREFLDLAAKLGVDAQAVVLNQPSSVCIERALKRVGHEGGVGAGNAGPLVSSYLRSRQLPSLAEGFSRISFCGSDADVEDLVQKYRDLRLGQSLEPGVFGAKRNGGKQLKLVDQIGKKKQTEAKATTNNDHEFGNGQEEAKEVGSGVVEEYLLMPKSTSSSPIGTRNVAASSSAIEVEDQGSLTLAFPSISTSDFQFDHERACGVLLDAVSEFLLKRENLQLRLVLVDLTSDSHMLSLVRQKAVLRGLDPRRFLTFVGDITKMRSSGGPACSLIANAANWRLKPGGGGVNAAIYKAAGAEFDQATKAVAQTLLPGKSVAVCLPVSSPLHKQEGVTHVIHVLGPNMNPQRPNCLAGNYFEGCKVLRSAYDSLFQNFSSVASNSASENKNTSMADSEKTELKVRKNAFTVMMQASKRKLEEEPKFKRDKVVVTHRVENQGLGTVSSVLGLTESSEPSKAKQVAGSSTLSTAGIVQATDRGKDFDPEIQGLLFGQNIQAANVGKRQWGQWSLSLFDMAMHPEQHKNSVLEVTDDAVVVIDKFPKAAKHLLVVSRKPELETLEDVRRKHLPILEKMHSLGNKWAASYLVEDPSLTFRIGYHSAPSMRQLHLHVISQDFNSPSLKNKKHWNSFTTAFFQDSLEIMEMLKEHGYLQISMRDAEDSVERLELRCHRCRSVHPNMPRLKQHIMSCSRPVASSTHLISSLSSKT